MGIDRGLGTRRDNAQTYDDETNDALILERETGIEPASLAWKAKVLPLNYSRLKAMRAAFSSFV